LFGHLDVWANVPDRDRRDLFDDVIHMLAKREKVKHPYDQISLILKPYYLHGL
jgi:hypothetical protein